MTKATIDFNVGDGEEGLTFSLIPLKTKTAIQIFHNILQVVLQSIAGAIKEDASEEEILAGLLNGLKSMDFDSFWFIAERLLKFATVNDKEIKNLEDAGWYKSNPLLLYRVVFEGVKGNYPEVFTKLGLGKDVSLGDLVTIKPLGDTPDQK